MADKPCTLIIHYDKGEPPQVNEIKKQLENGTVNDKIEAMKSVILLMLNGEVLPQLLMTVIRFVMPVDNHAIKKLLLLYWEIVDKTTADGKLLHEMILVCNALRNDLTHPNEYIRGVTLRFLTKLKEPEIMEPLLTSIKNALEDKHAYVRRNAVLALYNIYKNFDYLCPDAPELVYNFLINEGDASCKRNAFIMLFNCAQDKAFNIFRKYSIKFQIWVKSFNLLLWSLSEKFVERILKKDQNTLNVFSHCCLLTRQQFNLKLPER